MKTKLFPVLIFILFAISGCRVPKYLPKPQKIDVNQYGSYIKISRMQGSNIKGELLAVDTISLTVLADSSKQKIVKIVPVKEVKNFTLRYAQPKNYWWSLFVLPGICVFHGWWAIISVPINLIIAATVSASGSMAYKYSNIDITYDQLRMFARFPGGIPSNIILSTKK